MSSPSPFDGGNMFESLFAQLGRLFASEGPVNWELARQFAQWAAADGQPEPNVDPIERIRLEELVRVADLHVSDATGMSVSTTGRPVRVRPVGRSEWATATLDAWRPLLAALAEALHTPTDEIPPPVNADAARPADLGQMLGPLMPGLQAAFLGLQMGSMLGSMAQRALGQYDLPIPRPPSDELMVVSTNLLAFAGDWSLSADDVRLWVCLSELAHHAVLARPHVRSRLDADLRAYVSGFDPSSLDLDERLGQIDPSDPASLQQVLGDPGALLGQMQTPQQRADLARLESLVTVVEGYVDHVVDVAGRRLIGPHGAITEALRRRRVERGQGERMVERLLGVELGQAQYDRGAAFIRGVVERAGEDGLARLWQEERTLPTPAEVDAPGLWLERIDLPPAP